MRLAFIMPDDEQRSSIGKARERIVEMRPDQIEHLEHLLRSWGIFGRYDGLALTRLSLDDK